MFNGKSCEFLKLCHLTTLENILYDLEPLSGKITIIILALALVLALCELVNMVDIE